MKESETIDPCIYDSPNAYCSNSTSGWSEAGLECGFQGHPVDPETQAPVETRRVLSAVLYISVINSCNLRCQGCWVDVTAKQAKIEADAMHRMLGEAKAMGNSFFGILGGEPLMHPDCWKSWPGIPTATSRFSPTGTSSRTIWPARCDDGQHHAVDQRRRQRDCQRRPARGQIRSGNARWPGWRTA
jgi:hypothetical protein